MNLIEEIRSLSDIEITLISFAILFGIFNICIVTKLVSIQEKLEEVSKELKGIKDNHISEPKGEKQNTGYWIEREIEGTIRWKECSECHSEYPNMNGLKYCPNCGVKMKKEYELGNCPCCQKTDLFIADKKIICKFCNNWSWLEDAVNSSWIKEGRN